MKDLRRKEETSAQKEKWENAFSGKQLDSVHEETLAGSLTGKPRETDAITDTDLILVKEHNHPLLLLENADSDWKVHGTVM